MSQEQERIAFEAWAEKAWPNGRVPDNAWLGWLARSERASPPEGGAVPVPQNEDQAALMALLGEKWLRDNAPQRLTSAPAASEAVAWQAMALAKLGRVRDQMSPADVRCIQRFLDPAPLTGATHG